MGLHVQCMKLFSVPNYRVPVLLCSSTTWCTQRRTALLYHHSLGREGQCHSQPPRGTSEHRWCPLSLPLLIQESCPGRCTWFGNGYVLQPSATRSTQLSMYWDRCTSWDHDMLGARGYLTHSTGNVVVVQIIKRSASCFIFCAM